MQKIDISSEGSALLPPAWLPVTLSTSVLRPSPQNSKWAAQPVLDQADTQARCLPRASAWVRGLQTLPGLCPGRRGCPRPCPTWAIVGALRLCAPSLPWHLSWRPCQGCPGLPAGGSCHLCHRGCGPVLGAPVGALSVRSRPWRGPAWRAEPSLRGRTGPLRETGGQYLWRRWGQTHARWRLRFLLLKVRCPSLSTGLAQSPALAVALALALCVRPCALRVAAHVCLMCEPVRGYMRAPCVCV